MLKRKPAKDKSQDKAGGRPAKAETFDLLKAVKLRMDKQLTFKQIAKLMEVAPQTVEERMKRLGHAFNDPERLKLLKEHEPVMIDGIRSLLLERMSTVLGDNKTNISFSQLSLGYAIMLDKVRLLRNETPAGGGQITALIIAAHKVKIVTDKDKGYGKDEHGKVIDVTPEVEGNTPSS